MAGHRRGAGEEILVLVVLAALGLRLDLLLAQLLRMDVGQAVDLALAVNVEQWRPIFADGNAEVLEPWPLDHLASGQRSADGEGRYLDAGAYRINAHFGASG